MQQLHPSIHSKDHPSFTDPMHLLKDHDSDPPSDSDYSSSASDSGFSSSSPPTLQLSDHGDASTLSESNSEPIPSNMRVLDIRSKTVESMADSAHLARVVAQTLSTRETVFPASSARFDAEQNGKRAFNNDNNTAGVSIPIQDVLVRSIPTLVLYDDNGLDIFNDITHVDEYYVTNAEMQIFKDKSNEIAQTHVGNNGVLIELGVGSMRKTRYLLDAIVSQNKSVTYYALDLSAQSLTQSLQPLAHQFPSIKFVGLLGTYDDSLLYIKDHLSRDTGATRTLLWLGTSIGNTTRKEAAEFLERVKNLAMQDGDVLLCGIDRRNDASVVKAAYDDPKGVTRAFILNGLRHVERIFGGERDELLPLSKFEYVSLYNADLGRHEAYYRSLEKQRIEVDVDNVAHVFEFEEGELIFIEYSIKYDADDIRQLMDQSGLRWAKEWLDQTERYSLHCFAK
ncbi:histidine-specific methyltransferase [Chytriomyces cf. hyalinus JEL632]|nr:histidine-specific methyltransferase [Chytriomyces cf. hyalinus JEL632]